MNYEYDKPIIAQRRTGGSSNPYKEITESLIVNDDAKVILTEIPLEYNRVQVTGDNRAWYEIETGTPTSNQFKVNYINKIIEFDASNIGKQLTFTYTGTGLIYVPTSMIYTEENNGVVTQTLEDLTNEASESAQYAENQGDYAKQQGDYAKAEGEKVDEFVNNTAYVEPYNNATTYEKNNVVSYNGASFMAKQQTVGNPPPDPSVAEENEYWGLLSRKGADGNGTVATHEDRFIASEGQTVFNLSNTYDQFQNRTWVYVGGALQDYPENYEETTSTSITLSEGVPLGTEVVVKYFGESVPVESDIQNTVNNHTNVLANHSERLNQYQSDLTDTDATSGRQPDQSVWKEFEGRGVNVKWFGASGSDQETTGSIDAGSNILTVTDPKDFKVGHGIVIKGAGEGGVAEEVELQINSVPTSDGNISISLDGTEYTFPVDNGESEAVSLEITGQPTVDGNVTVTLDNVSTNIPVNDGEYEVVSLNITGQPSVDGDIVINLDGIPTNVSVDNGVAEESSIEIISDPTTAGDVIVTLDGVDHSVTIDPLVETTASDVADKIRSTSFSGWTTGGTVGTSIVTFTSDTTGDRVDTTYNENGTGATGAVTTNIQGVDPDTETEVADKIRNTIFEGWTTSGVGAEVFFTATDKVEKTDATYSDNGTGVTGNISTITQGMSPDTTEEIATKIRNTTFSGWNTSGTGSHITFISDQTGVREGITYSDNGTGVTGVTNVVNEGVNPDTTEEIATLIRGTEFEGWIVSGSDSVITFTSVLAEEKEDPVYSDGGTGVNGVINVLAEGIDGEDLLTEVIEVNGFSLNLKNNASTTVVNSSVLHDDTQALNDISSTMSEGMTMVFPIGHKFYTSGMVTIPSRVNVIMDSPIVYRGDGNEIALRVGEKGVTSPEVRLKLSVSRVGLSDWESESDIGIQLINNYTSSIRIVYVERFTIGVQMIGSGSGFVYNQIELGDIGTNKVGLDVTNETFNSKIGWNNENVFTNGRFWASSTAHKDKSRYGVRITSKDGTYENNNNNFFLKPSFEIKKPDIGEAIPILIEHGQTNEFESVRDEGNGDYVVRLLNRSESNIVQVGYGLSGMDDQSVYSSNVLILRRTMVQERTRGTVFKSGNLAKKLCLYDNTDRFNIAGLHVHSYYAENSRPFILNVTQSENGINLPPNQGVGVFLSTRLSKKFVVKRDISIGSGRVAVIPYDSSGNRLIENGGSKYVLGRAGRALGWNSSTYGSGAYITGSDSEFDTYFSVSSEVDYVEVLLSGESNLRGFSIESVDSFGADTWLAYDEPIKGVNVALQKPALNTVGFDGQITMNLSPVETGTAGNMYVVEGWQKVNGIWLEKRYYTGN